MAAGVTAALSGDLYQMLAFGGYLLLAVFLWRAIDPVTRWRYRHIPGPFGWPVVGNMPSILKHQLHIYLHMMHKQYGPIFKIWFAGTPWVIVCDPDNIRKCFYRLNSHLSMPNTMLGEERFMLDNSLVFSTGGQWRLLKKVWDPAILHRASLEGYAPLMQECSEGLLQRLEGAAQQGEVVDMLDELQRMTLDVVGSCAFGIKFSGSSTADGAGSEWGDSEELQDCSKKFFRSSMMGEDGSLWLLPILILPNFVNAIHWLAYRLPDKGHTMAVESMRGMASAARKIIAVSSAQRQQSVLSSAKSDAAGSNAQQDAAPTAVSDAAVQAAKMPAAGGRKPQGVLPGSFVAQLEARRAKDDPSGGTLSDDLIAAQVIQFLLGGYETTANALAFSLYRMSVHPEDQRKVQAELDTVLGGRKPTLDDLPKLPYLDACIKEAMRLHPPLPIVSRVFDDDEVHPRTLELCGKGIPKQAVTIGFWPAAGMSPDYWVRPEEFLPERFLPETGGEMGPFNDNAYLPFGAGGRKCVGYKFAEQEMMLAGAALLQKFTVTRPAGLGPLEETLGLTLAPRAASRCCCRHASDRKWLLPHSETAAQSYPHRSMSTPVSKKWVHCRQGGEPNRPFCSAARQARGVHEHVCKYALLFWW